VRPKSCIAVRSDKPNHIDHATKKEENDSWENIFHYFSFDGLTGFGTRDGVTYILKPSSNLLFLMFPVPR
jgi:hypothetical protein